MFVHPTAFPAVCILFTLLSVVITVCSGGSVPNGYENSEPAVVRECKECRESVTCVPKLDVRDTPSPPIPVPLPEVRYDVKWKAVEVPIRDFDVQEILVPKTVQLIEEKCRVEPTYQEKQLQKVIRVPRVVTNIVYQVVNRTKIRTVYKKRPKTVQCVVRRQVPRAQIKQKPTKAMRTRVIEKKIRKTINTSVYTDVECEYKKTDFPVRVPTTEFKYCEELVDVRVNGTCDVQVGATNNGYLPPSNLNKREVPSVKSESQTKEAEVPQVQTEAPVVTKSPPVTTTTTTMAPPTNKMETSS